MIPPITDAEVLQQLNARQAWHYRVVPFARQGPTLRIYYVTGTDLAGLEDELQMILDHAIELVPRTEEEIRAALSKYYR
jgi:general secretion pathway protein E/type IV pilus assembly protein PilB